MAKKAQALTGKQKKAAAAAGKSATGAAAATADKAKSKAVVTVDAKAMSVTVGPFVIQGLAKSYGDEAKAHELMREVQSKRYDMMAQLTAAISKAGKIDKTIDLASAFSGDAKAMGTLNDQLGIALGFREAITYQNSKGEDQQRIVYAKAVQKFFPTAKDPKGTDETKRKATLRSNFIHMLKKCTQAAVAINGRGIDVEFDKESGTLLISGPAVKKQFGMDEVLLNEKQTVGEGKDEVKLLEKPSYTALAAAAGVDHGAAVKRGGEVAHRGRSVGSNKPDAVIISMAENMVKALSKWKGEPTDKMQEALTALQSAVGKIIE